MHLYKPSKSDVNKLSDWYKKNKRLLPWRQDKNPYFIWISEVMLQQTTVVAVIPYFERFIKKFPDIQSLANAPLEDVLASWSGLGYYSRARNLHKSAQLISQQGFPQTFTALIQFPGFGPYTARAVSSIAFNERVGVLDGNVIRVLSRRYGIEKKWWEPKIKEDLQKLADDVVAFGEPAILNQGLMELGATVCTPEKPLCTLCPWSKNCVAFAHDLTKKLPLKKPRKQTDLWLYTPYIVENKTKTLFVKDHKFPFLKKIWTLPGEIKQTKQKPKEFIFKHSITHNYIYVLSPQKINSKLYKSIAAEMMWLEMDSIAKYSPSSLTKKIMETLITPSATKWSRKRNRE